MKTITTLYLIFTIITIGCKNKIDHNDKESVKVAIDQTLADELAQMAEIDQIAAGIPQGEYKKLSEKQWNSFKDSVFRTHTKRLKEIISNHGFPGYDLVGENGSSNFWLMTQHADHDPSFQRTVLQKMEQEIKKKNADSRDYGLLLDRVNLNTNQPQIYGTQVTYNTHTGQAYPKNLADSAKVNKRRQNIGFEPLEEYLNQMSSMHFEMNKEQFIKKGILKAKYYKIDSLK